jgi:hypothetical protein
MSDLIPHSIRRIFLTPRPNLPLMAAAERLGMTLQELKRDIADGAIVAVSTRVGTRVTKEEMIATAMRLWDQSAIEEALGDDAPRLLPEAIRLVELRARVPAISATSSASWPGAIPHRSMPSSPASWRTSPRRTRRSWRRSSPSSPQHWRGRV